MRRIQDFDGVHPLNPSLLALVSKLVLPPLELLDLRRSLAPQLYHG